MKEPLFRERIKNWDDWGAVFQSIPAFEGLVKKIYLREGLPFFPLEHLTPGTNAVFQVGNTVAKVFFPKESGLDPSSDFHNEAAVCARLTAERIPSPRLLAQGMIRDAYDFYYIITEYSPGKEAGDWLASASPAEKRAFARRLRELLARLNQPAEGLIPPIDLLRRAVENPRLSKLSPALREEMRRRAEGLDLSQRVLVHGDLTGENLLIGEDGELQVIDCADACLAPAWYELGPIVFELFRCDPILLRTFAGPDWNKFTELALDAVSVHDFGADLLLETARRENLPPFTSLRDVKAFLLERLESTMTAENELLKELHKLHTTELGAARIKKNLSLDTDNVVDWCKAKISSPNALITRNGKNWYVTVGGCVITVNAGSYTIITAHKK